MEIRLVKKENLDKIKWNSCVHYAINGNVFGYKWFLDSVSKEWDALVESDYESVFPLFHTKIDYSNYHQILLKESVIYSVHLLSQKRISAFIEAIPANYKNIDVQFKNGIQLPENKNFELKQIKNQQLFLQSPYDTIQNNYSETLKVSLKDAKQNNLKPISSIKPEKIAVLFKENFTKSKETEAAFHAYQRIMYNALHRGWGFASGIVDEKNTLLAAAFFIYSHGKILTLLAPETANGKKLGARDLLFDFFIRNNAGRPQILDFNMDDTFPKKFGALQKIFQQLNRKNPKWWKVY
jgi:hypothetical protein